MIINVGSMSYYSFPICVFPVVSMCPGDVGDIQKLEASTILLVEAEVNFMACGVEPQIQEY